MERLDARTLKSRGGCGGCQGSGGGSDISAERADRDTDNVASSRSGGSNGTSFKLKEMASSVSQVDDEEDEDLNYTDDVPMTLSFDESDNPESDAEEWFAEDGGTFRRMNTHLDAPRQKMADTAFEMQSLHVGSPLLTANSILQHMEIPSHSQAQEGHSRWGASSRIKKARRHEEEPLHDDGLREDEALARRARHHDPALYDAVRSCSTTTGKPALASASMDYRTDAQSGSATIHYWTPARPPPRADPSMRPEDGQEIAGATWCCERGR